jgi:hypothetical protein
LVERADVTDESPDAADAAVSTETADEETEEQP